MPLANDIGAFPRSELQRAPAPRRQGGFLPAASVPFVTEIPTLNTWGLLSLVFSLGCTAAVTFDPFMDTVLSARRETSIAL
jgi:hypothetical protein